MRTPFQEVFGQVREAPRLPIPAHDAVRRPLDRRVDQRRLLVRDHEVDHDGQGLLPFGSLRGQFLGDLLRWEFEE